MVDYPPIYPTKQVVTVVIKNKHTKPNLITTFYYKVM